MVHPHGRATRPQRCQAQCQPAGRRRSRRRPRLEHLEVAQQRRPPAWAARKLAGRMAHGLWTPSAQMLCHLLRGKLRTPSTKNNNGLEVSQRGRGLARGCDLRASPMKLPKRGRRRRCLHCRRGRRTPLLMPRSDEGGPSESPKDASELVKCSLASDPPGETTKGSASGSRELKRRTREA